jgi:hypothetical protein
MPFMRHWSCHSLAGVLIAFGRQWIPNELLWIAERLAYSSMMPGGYVHGANLVYVWL